MFAYDPTGRRYQSSSSDDMIYRVCESCNAESRWSPVEYRNAFGNPDITGVVPTCNNPNCSAMSVNTRGATREVMVWTMGGGRRLPVTRMTTAHLYNAIAWADRQWREMDALSQNAPQRQGLSSKISFLSQEIRRREALGNSWTFWRWDDQPSIQYAEMNGGVPQDADRDEQRSRILRLVRRIGKIDPLSEDNKFSLQLLRRVTAEAYKNIEAKLEGPSPVRAEMASVSFTRTWKQMKERLNELKEADRKRGGVVEQIRGAEVCGVISDEVSPVFVVDKNGELRNAQDFRAQRIKEDQDAQRRERLRAAVRKISEAAEASRLTAKDMARASKGFATIGEAMRAQATVLGIDEEFRERYLKTPKDRFLEQERKWFQRVDEKAARSRRERLVSLEDLSIWFQGESSESMPSQLFDLAKRAELWPDRRRKNGMQKTEITIEVSAALREVQRQNGQRDFMIELAKAILKDAGVGYQPKKQSVKQDDGSPVRKIEIKGVKE